MRSSISWNRNNKILDSFGDYEPDKHSIYPNLVQKCYDQHQTVFIYFIDYRGAFDNIKDNLIFQRLQEIGRDDKNSRITQNLY